MNALLALSFKQYMRTYQRYAYEFWEGLTPMQYGSVLIIVFVAGFLLLRSGNKI